MCQGPNSSALCRTKPPPMRGPQIAAITQHAMQQQQLELYQEKRHIVPGGVWGLGVGLP